jgi:uncharacterized protein (TIGR02594 family)
VNVASDKRVIEVPIVPPWLAHALAEIGTLEISGTGSNPRIEEYHATTRGPATVKDDVPWCSSFQNWSFDRCGIEPTRSKAARSWLDWGIELQRPVLGCVCVLWREARKSAKGHVGLWLGQDKRGVYLLGGNQSNAVNVMHYPHARVLDGGFRWPACYPLPPGALVP